MLFGVLYFLMGRGCDQWRDERDRESRNFSRDESEGNGGGCCCGQSASRARCWKGSLSIHSVLSRVVFCSFVTVLTKEYTLLFQMSGMEEPLEIPVLNDLTMVLGSIAQVLYSMITLLFILFS